MATVTLDTTGMNCPIPILKARKSIKAMAVGDTLEPTANPTTSSSSKVVLGFGVNMVRLGFEAVASLKKRENEWRGS